MMLLAGAPAYADAMTAYDLYQDQDCTSSVETDRMFCLGFIAGGPHGVYGKRPFATDLRM
jgi:hypothetical protein